MNISEIEIQHIRPNANGNKILGNVTFHISGGVGDRRDVMNFECSCNAFIDEAAKQGAPHVRKNLKADAMRQANRMPEFRSGKDNLVFLCPKEDH